jgi:ubiquinone/menaquinone biosynthesis C-methylase UbiE
MRSAKPHRYIHGSEPKEQKRLSLLNELLNRACLQELQLKGNEAVLDVGSGLGQFTREVARAVCPGGCVVGIERDQQQLKEAQRQADEAGESGLVEWRRGDALQLPLTRREWGTFDVVHARFVLEHLKEPERAVGQMVAAARRGGRVVLADDDHPLLHLWPEVTGFVELWQAYMRAYEHLRCDPLVGRRLVSLLHEAGARPLRNHWIFFGSCAGTAEFPAFMDNLIGVIETAREVMTGPVGFDEKQFNRALRAVRQWAGRSDSALWYGLSWAEAVRP